MRNLIAFFLITFLAVSAHAESMAQKEFTLFQSEADAVSKAMSDCHAIARVQISQVERHKETARIEHGNLVLKTMAGEKILPAGIVPCGKAEGFSSDMTLYVLMGTVPSLHLAVVQKIEVEWEEYAFVDLTTGTITSSPSYDAVFSPSGQLVAFANYDGSSMGLDGVSVFSLQDGGLHPNKHYDNDRIGCVPRLAINLAAANWQDETTLRLDYTVQNLDNPDTRIEPCNFTVN